MLNEERVKLMTKMAAYEESEGKKNIAVASYFRGDYISLQILKSVISATIAFLLVFAMYIFYDFEIFMQDVYKVDLLGFGKKVLFIYFIVVAIYVCISYVVASYRYSKATKSLKNYYHNLKILASSYHGENER